MLCFGTLAAIECTLCAHLGRLWIEYSCLSALLFLCCAVHSDSSHRVTYSSIIKKYISQVVVVKCPVALNKNDQKNG